MGVIVLFSSISEKWTIGEGEDREKNYEFCSMVYGSSLVLQMGIGCKIHGK